jgi:hypothetical protein
LRGIESQLQCGLEDGEPEVGEEVADGVFGLVDDLSGLRCVDGSRDVVAEYVKAFAEELAECIGGQLRGSVHDCKPKK